jgi:GH25 family lysozyme M1 (1,4-beta-N-acetylmuramidase)
MVSPAPYLPPVMSDVVIDVSHYENVSQDFVTTAKAGIAAVILKATQGTGFVDPTFLSRAGEARTAGLEVGAYHFLDGSNPAEQAAHFLTVAVSEGMVNWLALDWEPYPPSQACRPRRRLRAFRPRPENGRFYIRSAACCRRPTKRSRAARCG